LITTVITFLTEKVVAVVITTVVVVAAVPTLIIAINGNTITTSTGVVVSTTRITTQDERTLVIVEVKTAGDAAILKLKNLEMSCGVQIDQLAAKSKISSAATGTTIQNAKNNFHNSVVPFVHEIEADEDEISHLSVITVETEQAFLVRINTVLVLALGDEGHAGSLLIVCQTIIVQITQILVIQTGGERDSDIKKAA
jgi:hypothetical protein